MSSDIRYTFFVEYVDNRRDSCRTALIDSAWLLIYHSVKAYGGHLLYRAGVALRVKDRPHKTIARSRNWIFQAEAPCELSGLTPNVVFPTGLLLRCDELWMYYGAAAVAPVRPRQNLTKF